MTLRSTVMAACAMSALSGCYFLFPAKLPPGHKGDLIVEGEQMEVKTREVKTFVGSCSDSDIEKGRCELHRGKLTRWYMQTHARVKYGGRDLTYAELRELADPEYPQRIATMKSLKRACTTSLIPSALAVASIAIGVLAPQLEAGKLNDNQKNYFYIGGGVGAAVFGALSYPLGGYACVKSNHVARADYDWARDDWEGDGADLQKLVDDFNTRIRGGAASAPAATTPDAPGDPSSEPGDRPRRDRR